MAARPRLRLVAFLATSLVLLFMFSPLSADRPPDRRIRLRAPSASTRGGHAVVGVELANDVRARLRNRGGRINVHWQSSRGEVLVEFRERTSGELLSSAVISADTLVQQADGSFTGNSHTFSVEVVPRVLDARLSLTLLVNGSAVASDTVQVTIQPVATPISVTIVSAPSEVRAGSEAPLTVGVSGLTSAQVTSLSWGILGPARDTLATANIPPEALTPANNHLEATVTMALGPSIAPGDYTLQAAMLTVAGERHVASQPIRVLEGAIPLLDALASYLDSADPRVARRVEQVFSLIFGRGMSEKDARALRISE